MTSPTLTIRPLNVEDAPAISRELTAARESYVQWFHPFEFDEDSIGAMIGRATHDAFFGLFYQDSLAGFFMLRGFDAGFERPSFGVFIAEKYAGAGLSKTALAFSLSWCRLLGCGAVMLKVHPAHSIAKKTYLSAGFTPIGSCPDSGHEMFELKWE